MNQKWIVDAALSGEVVCNIGQIQPETIKTLNRLVRAGSLHKWRGYWYPVTGADWGIGPLKTCWGSNPRVYEGAARLSSKNT